MSNLRKTIDFLHVAWELPAWYGPELFYWARDAQGSNAEVVYLLSKRSFSSDVSGMSVFGRCWKYGDPNQWIPTAQHPLFL